MANSKITVESLNLHYGENHALKNVNMEIADHAITAFIGPSGCGKSTFLRCLNRMNDLVDGCRVEGKVILDGEDIYDKRVDTTLLRKKVGMVFQQPNPFPMSIYDNIAYGPRLHGIKNKKELDEIVELIVETVCARRKTTRIAGADFPHEVVRSRFLKLDSEHIRFVMDSLQKNTTEVRNMKQYLLTVLFNAPTTISNHYTSQVNHDMNAGGW